MKLNGTRKLDPETQAKIGTVIPPKVDARNLVLNSIIAGHNTRPAIIETTKLDAETVAREIDILNNLIIKTHPGPPVESFWLSSKLPKGRVYLDNGRIKAEKANTTIIHNFRPAARRRTQTENENSAETIRDLMPAADETAHSANYISADESPAAGAPSESVTVVPDDFRSELPVAALDPHPDNPRGAVDEDHPDFAALVESVRAQGIQQPPVVTPSATPGRYRIVIGHRRHRAAIAAGLEIIPAIIRHYASPAVEEEAMLIENMQRQDLNPIQEAKALKKAYDREQGNIHGVARKLGLTQSTIANRIKLLKLDIGIQIMLERGEISLETGMILSALPHSKQLRLIARAPRMKSADLRSVVKQMQFTSEIPVPASRVEKIREKRVTTDEEKFTRSGAMKTLDSLGDGAWVDVSSLKRAFDDVCIDSCLESKDETICNGCPVPRFIHSLTRRHTKRSEQ